jgi:hypothetical protein
MFSAMRSFAWIVVAAASCSAPAEPLPRLRADEVPVRPAAASLPLADHTPGGAAIVALQTRDARLVVASGPGGTVFRVGDRAGALLSEPLDEAQLQDRHQDLYRLYNRATAAPGEPYLDASVDQVLMRGRP